MTSRPSHAATTPVDDGADDAPAEPTAATGSARSAPDSPDAPSADHATPPEPAQRASETEPTQASETEPTEASETGAAEHFVSRRRRERRRRWALLTVLVVLLLGASAGGVYLWRVAEAWIERDAQWQSHSTELTGTIGEVSQELEDTKAELEVVRGQLDQAQLRISELADEKARLGDEHAVVRQLAEYQERVTTAATAVVGALDSCIASQQRLIRWYAETPEPEPEDLETFTELSGALDEVCSAAQEAKESLQEELEG